MATKLNLMVTISLSIFSSYLFADESSEKTEDQTPDSNKLAEFSHVLEITPNFSLFSGRVSEEFGLGFSYEKVSADNRNLIISLNSAQIRRSDDEIEILREDTNNVLKKNQVVNSALFGIRNTSQKGGYVQFQSGLLQSKSTYDANGIVVKESAMAVPVVLGLGFRGIYESGFTTLLGFKIELFQSLIYRNIETETRGESEKIARDQVRKEAIKVSDAFFQYGLGYAF